MQPNKPIILSHALQSLDRSLSVSSSDSWYDSGIDITCKVLHSLSSNGWKSLRDIWTLKSQEWQERLAYAVSSETKEGVALLEGLLTSPYKEVAELAFDALFIDNKTWKPKPRLIPFIIRVESYVKKTSPHELPRFHKMIGKNKKETTSPHSRS